MQFPVDVSQIRKVLSPLPDTIHLSLSIMVQQYTYIINSKTIIELLCYCILVMCECSFPSTLPRFLTWYRHSQIQSICYLMIHNNNEPKILSVYCLEKNYYSTVTL